MDKQNNEANVKTRICRLCLAHTNVYFSLTQNIEASQMLEALTSIEIQPSEQTSIMCYKCKLNLNLAYKIRQNIIKCEEKFRARFSAIRVKEEFEITETQVCDGDKVDVMSQSENFQKLTEHVCDICQKSFDSKTKLGIHIREVHTQVNCEVCKLEVKLGSLRKHMRRKHAREFKNFVKMEVKKPPRIYQCDLCKDTFPNKTKLSIHKSKHMRSVCVICGKEMQTKYLENHLQLHANREHQQQQGNEENPEEKFFACRVCDKTFINGKLSKQHEKLHKRTKCPICDRDVLHVNLQQHVRTHSDAYKQMCELCGATLKNKFCLKVHLRRSHQNTQFKCKYCDKIYRSKKSVKMHELKEHLREANHVCDICGKKFYSGVYLKKHVEMKHLKLRPYVCDVCNKAFSSSFALRTHRRIHTNETPYRCQECGEGFRQKVSLKSHLKSKHKIEEKLTHFCELCDKGFASSVALYSHQRVHDP